MARDVISGISRWVRTCFAFGGDLLQMTLRVSVSKRYTDHVSKRTVQNRIIFVYLRQCICCTSNGSCVYLSATKINY